VLPCHWFCFTLATLLEHTRLISCDDFAS
jgi:hypothetical protein